MTLSYIKWLIQRLCLWIVSPNKSRTSDSIHCPFFLHCLPTLLHDKFYLFLWIILEVNQGSSPKLVLTYPLPPVEVQTWTTLTLLPQIASPPRKWSLSHERGRKVHEKLTGSLLTWGVTRTETQTIPHKVLFLVFSTEMTADRSTWETSCIWPHTQGPPFTETGLTQAERAPISDVASVKVESKNRRPQESSHWTSTCWTQ